jgi:hypothetical protein
MTTVSKINTFQMMKFLPFDITNIIYEFIGDEDAKDLFTKNVLCNSHFIEQLNRRFCSNLHHIRDKKEIILRWAFYKDDCSHSVSDILFVDDNDDDYGAVIKTKQMERKYKMEDGTTKRFYYESHFSFEVYSDEELKEQFTNVYEDIDNSVCYLSAYTIREYFNCCKGKAKLTNEEIEALQDYNNPILQSILKSLIGNVEDFVDWFFENNYWEMVSGAFGDEDNFVKLEGFEDGDLLRIIRI